MPESNLEPVSATERRRRRVVEAATALLLERDGGHITFDEVAARTELSRRTIYNYFPSIDDLEIAVVTQMIGGILESVSFDFAADGAQLDTPEQVFAELAAAVHGEQAVPILVRLTRALGGMELSDPRIAGIVGAACSQVADRLADDVAARSPRTARLGIELLASALIGGLPVLYRHWRAASGVVDTPESRRRWRALLESHLLTVRDGYLAAARTEAAPSAARQTPSSESD